MEIIFIKLIKSVNTSDIFVIIITIFPKNEYKIAKK